MADPLSIIASLLAVSTAAIQSTRCLKEAARRYKGRDATVRRLHGEAADVEAILSALEELLKVAASQSTGDVDASMAVLLRGPIERCSTVCTEFVKAMERFSSKAKTNVLDWAKMEFMRGDMNQFMDSLSGYKATISVGLGVLTMRTVRLSHQALEEYDEMVQDTMYALNLRLQRIDDNMAVLAPVRGPSTPSANVDLSNERDVTRQCLQICEDAKAYLESLASRDSTLLNDAASGDSATVALQQTFEAQLLTRKALDENQASFVKIITQLRGRLESVMLDGDSSERSRLQQDIQMSKQCLEVCKLASSEVANQKIHIIGEAVAEGESDQIVVTTLAGMFNVGRAIARDKSAMLVGSMSDEALMQLSRDRYNSRFGAANTEVHVNTHGNSPPSNMEPSGPRQSDRSQQRPRHRSPPSSNETRKRMGNPDS